MTSHASASRNRSLPRTRGIAAASAVAVFFGTAAMAPFSVSDASATPGQVTAGELEYGPEQELEAVSAPEAFVDTELNSVELHGAATAGSGSEDGANTGDASKAPSEALYTLEEFMFSGVVNWGGYKFTFYSQQVLPGPGLAIPGRHVNEAGYVSDGDGYIVLASDAPKGAVFETPFGYPGKVYDRGVVGNHLDVYIR